MCLVAWAGSQCVKAWGHVRTTSECGWPAMLPAQAPALHAENACAGVDLALVAPSRPAPGRTARVLERDVLVEGSSNIAYAPPLDNENDAVARVPAMRRASSSRRIGTNPGWVRVWPPVK